MKRSAITIFAALVPVILAGQQAAAQVRVEATKSELVIQNAGFEAQRAVRAETFSEEDVRAVDGSYEETCRTCNGKERKTWTASGYQTGDGVDLTLIEGYDVAVQHLVDEYGAVVEHDDVLDVDYISFPNAEDPYEVLVFALLNDYVLGFRLVEFFRTLEMITRGGSYPAGIKVPLLGAGTAFPNDPYFSSEWNLTETRLYQAALMRFAPRLDRPVRIGLIDSGIDPGQAAHRGLDGWSGISHTWTEEPTGEGSSHALALATLLGDAAHDGEAGIGLLGRWPGGCNPGSSLRFELRSYNAGDFGPMSYLVARAVTLAVEDAVDVINLSMRIGYSPMVQQAIQYALDRGIVVVASAGNFKETHLTKPTGFPATIPGVIAVTGATRTLSLNRLSAASGYHIAAPGEEILIGAPLNTWEFGEGTSYAAPHVTAAAAFMKAANPSLTSVQTRDILIATARKDKGIPFLDAFAALNAALPEGERRNSVSSPSSCAGKTGESVEVLPEEFALHGNYPNPFNPSTTFALDLPERGNVRIVIYDLTGRAVATAFDSVLEAGRHELAYTAAALPSGTYVYSVQTDIGRATGMMTLAK